MADHDYMANPDAEFFDNLNSGENLSGDALHQVAESWSAVKGKVSDRVARLRLVLSEGNLGQVGTSEDWWTGTGGDAHRDELTSYSNYVQNSMESGPTQYEKHVKDLADGTAEARSTAGQPMGALFGSGSNPAETTRAVARATQKLYYNPGTPVAEELQYPGEAPKAPSLDDFTAPPKGAGQPQPSTSGASSGGAPTGGAAPHESAFSPMSATPQQDDAAGSQQPEAQADAKPSGEGAGAGSGSGGAGSGGGSGDGGKGSGAGAGGGSPFGGSPAAGTPSAGSGFDPSESGATHAMSAGDWTPSSSGGGSGLGGGVGTLGGDHERSLSAKSSPGGLMGSKPVVNVNGLGGSNAAQSMGMGGGMGGMGGAAGGQNAGKEHKTPDYLKNTDHGNELIGNSLPVAIPEVIGELNKDEYQRMLEAQAKQQGGGPGGA